MEGATRGKGAASVPRRPDPAVPLQGLHPRLGPGDHVAQGFPRNAQAGVSARYAISPRPLGCG